ncbi:MAG: PIG-L family deacetylase [Oricola sp.]
MTPLNLVCGGRGLDILCFGAHSDDIEIGLGGTILSLVEAGAIRSIAWCVLSAVGQREIEAERSAKDFLGTGCERQIRLGKFEDTYFPAQSRAIKEWMLDIRSAYCPDLIFTHGRGDAHQDHREVNTLTWNVFRDHLIMEYEIPKWDGDLGQPNFYYPVSEAVMEAKLERLDRNFGSQRSKDWFDPDTFRGLARLRGMECRAPERYAEAFTIRKVVLGVNTSAAPPDAKLAECTERLLEPV